MLKIWNMWLRYKTKNFTRIPLFVMFFDYQKYKKNGAKGSCDWYSHPNIMKDEYIRERMQLKMIEVDIIKGLEELKKNTTGEALELFDRHMWENLKCVP